MRIVYCTPALYYAGGVERVLTLKANYFSEIWNDDVYIVVTDGKMTPPFYPLNKNVHLINLNINYDDLSQKSLYIRFLLYIYKQLRFRKKLSSILNEIKPDITISTLRREINFITSINDGSIKLGEIHVGRDNYRDFKQSKMPFFLQSLLRSLWMRQLITKIKKLDCFVLLSNEDKKKWPEIKESKMAVIYNPLPFYSEQTSLCNNKKVIAVGRYTYQKGFDLLIEAWEIINKKYPEWELHIYGDGDRSSYQKQIDGIGLQHSCFSHPACSNIQEKYLESSIFAFSSRYEGFGMVLAEAMACGVPPVSFDCPSGPKDIIDDGTDGILVENGNIKRFADQIIYLIENEAIRKKMGKRAHENAARFKMENIAQEWKNLFEELVNNRIKN